MTYCVELLNCKYPLAVLDPRGQPVVASKGAGGKGIALEGL